MELYEEIYYFKQFIQKTTFSVNYRFLFTNTGSTRQCYLLIFVFMNFDGFLFVWSTRAASCHRLQAHDDVPRSNDAFASYMRSLRHRNHPSHHLKENK